MEMIIDYDHELDWDEMEIDELWIRGDYSEHRICGCSTFDQFVDILRPLYRISKEWGPVRRFVTRYENRLMYLNTLMTDSVPADGARFVAAITPPRSQSAFNRGRLIVRGSNGTLLRSYKYIDADRIGGLVVTEENYRHLLAAGELLGIPQRVGAAPDAMLWVLRYNLPGRDRAIDELLDSGAVVSGPLVGLEDSRLCIVRASDASDALLDTWRDAAMTRATAGVVREDWDVATENAELAHAFCRGLNAEVLALLRLVYERTNRGTRARGLATMARRSRGDDFAEQVESALTRLRSS